jgi:homodimeric glycerol 3-phosphate dehydrogenase (quinone) (EC 1.1.5.3)
MSYSEYVIRLPARPRIMTAPVDLLIIGGGINGTGTARDAAGRGLSVLLVEQDDLASHTSSASTKLVHGGLRYLEYYEFRLVREALMERERLLTIAPHIIWPLEFVLPHSAEQRPAWMIRAGLFMYDHLAKRRRLPPRARSGSVRTPPPQSSNRKTAKASPTPIAGSKTAASSSSTRWMRANAAPMFEPEQN